MAEPTVSQAVEALKLQMERYLVGKGQLAATANLRFNSIEEIQPVLACYLLTKQCDVLDGMKQEQEAIAKTYQETHAAVVEMKNDSKAIRRLTIVLVLLTVALGYFAYKLDSVVHELRDVVTEQRTTDPSSHPNR